MADILKNLFGGQPSAAPAKPGDSDFADFAGAPAPTPAFQGVADSVGGSGATATARPYTAWYNIHERYTLADFQAEGIILVVIVFVFLLHFIGARRNRSKAKAWLRAHNPLLTSEFSQVGFKLGAEPESKDQLKEKSLFEFASYATGRQNVAFMDVKLTLVKRFNPIMTLIETAMGFAVDSMPSPHDSLETFIYPFDGREAQLVPAPPGGAELRAKDAKSNFDGFVWAVVNKDYMKQLREDRYDLSITFTKDNSKLPVWATVMSESAEITEALLTPELVKAVESAGDLFEYLLVSDQPVDKPTTIEETVPRKRLFLRYRLPSSDDYSSLVPLFTCFVRLSDQLASLGHFRPEVQRKLKIVREDTIKQIKKVAEDEKAEERAAEREKAKKAKREAELSALDAKAQKKYLEKEKEKEIRKANKRSTVKG